jgi:5'-nucleotidase (lipoprotein e(P4) family)
MKRLARALVMLLAAAACRSAGPAAPTVPGPPPPAATAAPTAPPAAAGLPTALLWSRGSAEHRALFLQVFAAAVAQLEREVRTRAPGSWAVVSDADETLIDNSTYQLERARAGEPHETAAWREWTRRREAVPLPGAKAFLERVRALGGKIAVVTNRRASECPDTEAVFRSHGMPYDLMLCMPEAGPSDKGPRFEAVARGTTPAGLPPLEVLAFLGDSIRDFPGLGQSLRDRPEADFAPFGSRFFVFPNPMYGSWERN